LAGTVARSGDPNADAALTGGMLESPKERQEHRLVVETVAAALRPVCRALDVPESPSIVALRNVSHLATRLSGVLSAVRIADAKCGAAVAQGGDLLCERLVDGIVARRRS